MANATWRVWDRVDGIGRSGTQEAGSVSGKPPYPLMPHALREGEGEREA